MGTWTRELKVGLMALFAMAFAAWWVLLTDDRPDGALEGYVLYADFPSVEGVQVSTQVRIAGVDVGSVRDMTLVGEKARVTLEMSGAVKLPKDSIAELRGNGVLGDKVVVIRPGAGTELLVDQDVITTKVSGPDLDKLTGQAEEIATNVEAITKSLRAYLEDEGLKGSLETSVRNIESLSAQIAELSASNREEVDAITQNLKEVSELLKEVVGGTSRSIESELAVVQQATEKLDRTMGQVEQLMTRVNNGEGTVGRLLTDDGPVQDVELALDQINTTLGEVNGLVRSFNDLRAEVLIDSVYYLGTAPNSSDFVENPVAGGSRSALGIHLMPREDYGYWVEVVSHPIGTIEPETTVAPDLGWVYTRYLVTQDLRFSFQFARRFGPVNLRLGIKDSSGGVGLDGYLWKDRVTLSADLYDFTYGSWPVLDGTPNLNLNARVEPYPHVFVQGGLHNVLLGARHGFLTGYVGAGVRFNDDDIRWILATLPGLP